METYEHKTVKVDAVNARKQQKVLEREYADGWELVQITKGPVFRSWSLAQLRRVKA